MKAVPTIPGYELLACLGGGAITSVYAARAVDTDAPCAVKLLRPEWEDQPVGIKLLQREARALLTVRHSHLVPLRDAHVTRPPYFVVMDLLPGESLRRRLRRDYSLDVPAALWILRQTAEALAALHRKGFLHGDVKPDNMRLAAPGRAILLDLGFAHRPGENAALLERGYILGTVDYLAPELCGAQASDDRRSDVYSLGVTLFEMIAGRLPFPTGSVPETLYRHRMEAPADLRDHVETVPPSVAQLVGRMLAREPADRPSADLLVPELIGLEIAALGRRRAA
jgi:eukaryotic-like serine/threonine-protein kinase